jgi:hypothetical protein
MTRVLLLAFGAMAMTLMLGVGPAVADSDVGWLDVDVSSPPPAAIFIDDRGLTDRAGKPLLTPQKHLPLAAGSHSVVLQTPDGTMKSKPLRFSIAAGQTTRLTLQPKPQPK